MNKVWNYASRADEFLIHPLGFFYLRDEITRFLARRVHVWINEAHPVNERHTHSFDISSSVARGRLKSELFHFSQSSEAPEHEFEVLYEGGRSSVRPTGRKGHLEAFATFDTIAGSSYFLRAGVIHQARAVEFPCVTILDTEEQKAPIRSYGTDVNEGPFTRRQVTMAEAEQIARVLRGLTGD